MRGFNGMNGLSKTAGSVYVWLRGSVAIGLALCAGQGCAVALAEKDVFRPNESNRRDQTAPLTLDNEARLPASVTLRHHRLATAMGALAVTLADTSVDRLILHCGGNASDRKTDGVSYLEKVTRFGDVMLFDYPGYGDSEGAPVTADFEAAIDGVVEQARRLIDRESPAQVVVWGHSLGGFVCSRVVTALGAQVSRVVLETSAQNAAQVAKVWVPWYAKPFYRIEINAGLTSYDNAAALRGFSGKVLVLGAGKDRVLPASLSRSLHEGLQGAGVNAGYHEFPKATHFNVDEQPEFRAVIEQFLANSEAELKLQ